MELHSLRIKILFRALRISGVVERSNIRSQASLNNSHKPQIPLFRVSSKLALGMPLNSPNLFRSGLRDNPQSSWGDHHVALNVRICKRHGLQNVGARWPMLYRNHNVAHCAGVLVVHFNNQAVLSALKVAKSICVQSSFPCKIDSAVPPARSGNKAPQSIYFFLLRHQLVRIGQTSERVFWFVLKNQGDYVGHRMALWVNQR